MIGLSSFVASPLRLEPPYGDVEGGVDVAHGVEQADQVGRVVGIGRRLGAGTEEQASRKTFEDCEVLVVGGGYILVFGLSGRAACLPPGPSSSAQVETSGILLQPSTAFFW